MRATAALALLAGLLLCSTAASSAPRLNVKGTFIRSTSTTVCQRGEPCDPPLQATSLVFTRNGRTTRVNLTATGSFALHLAAGVYTVSSLPGRPGTVTPGKIRVPQTGVIHPRLVQRGLIAPA